MVDFFCAKPQKFGSPETFGKLASVLLDWKKRSLVCRDEKHPTSSFHLGHFSARHPSRSIRLGKDCCLALGCDQLSPTKKHLARVQAEEKVCYSFIDILSWWWSLLQPLETLSMFRTLPIPAGKTRLCFSRYSRHPAKRRTWMLCLFWPYIWDREMSWPQQEGRGCLRSHIWFYLSSRFSCFKQKHMAGIFTGTVYLHYTKCICLHLEESPEVAFRVWLAVCTKSRHRSVGRTCCVPCPTGGISVVAQGLVD